MQQISPLKVVFMGTPEFAAWALGALIDGPHKVIAVYSQPPRPSGRGMKLTPSPVQQTAEKFDIPVFTPKSLKTAEAQEQFKNLNADIAIVAAYGLILPKAILDAPRLGCVNIHASLLPRWRGAAPIQRAILAGDAQTGITFMQMDEGLDTGAMLKTYPVTIQNDMTSHDLLITLAQTAAREINNLIDNMAQGRISPLPQPAEGVTYADKLKKEEGKIEWNKPANDLHRMVRALNPWPGAWFEHHGENIKVLSAETVMENGSPGAVLHSDGTIACGEGALRILSAQRPGKSPVDGRTFLSGLNLKSRDAL